VATTTHVFTLEYVAELLGEDLDLLTAITSNPDNLTYGAIVLIVTGSDDVLTGLTDGGIEELADMLKAARKTPSSWHDFLQAFVDDRDLMARIATQPLR
jgi:hypothetical protein